MRPWFGVLASDPRPNAPDGAEPGPLAAGVRTVLFSLPDLQIDIMGLIEANAPGLADDTLPRKPRALLCEVCSARSGICGRRIGTLWIGT